MSLITVIITLYSSSHFYNIFSHSIFFFSFAGFVHSQDKSLRPGILVFCPCREARCLRYCVNQSMHMEQPVIPTKFLPALQQCLRQVLPHQGCLCINSASHRGTLIIQQHVFSPFGLFQSLTGKQSNSAATLTSLLGAQWGHSLSSIISDNYNLVLSSKLLFFPRIFSFVKPSSVLLTIILLCQMLPRFDPTSHVNLLCDCSVCAA